MRVFRGVVAGLLLAGLVAAASGQGRVPPLRKGPAIGLAPVATATTLKTKSIVVAVLNATSGHPVTTAQVLAMTGVYKEMHKVSPKGVTSFLNVPVGGDLVLTATAPGFDAHTQTYPKWDGKKDAFVIELKVKKK